MSFECPFCGMVSHNPHDAEHRYCGNCHVFVDDARAEASEMLRKVLGHAPFPPLIDEVIRFAQRWERRKHRGE